MKNIMVIALLAIGINASAQKDCAYEVNNIDKFDSKTEKITSPIVIARKVKRKRALDLRQVQAQLKNYDGAYYFALKFPVTAIMTPTFKDDESGSRLILLLDNKEKMELPLANLMNNVKDKIEVRYGADFDLSKKEIQTLKKHKITDIRVALDKNTFDVPLEAEASEKLMVSFGCIE